MERLNQEVISFMMAVNCSVRVIVFVMFGSSEWDLQTKRLQIKVFLSIPQKWGYFKMDFNFFVKKSVF